MIPGKQQTTLINVLLVGNSQCPATALWKDYDPNHGDFQEEIVNQENRDGVFHRDSYISAYVPGEEVRVYCRDSVIAVVAVVAYFGVGYNDYYRDKQVWLKNSRMSNRRSRRARRSIWRQSLPRRMCRGRSPFKRAAIMTPRRLGKTPGSGWRNMCSAMKSNGPNIRSP